jgi:hypothetical protein
MHDDTSRRSELSQPVAVIFLGIGLSFVSDLLLHPDDVDKLQKVQQRSMESVEAFTPSEFGSRFIAAMSSDPDVVAAQKERESWELNRKGREASQQIAESAKRFEAVNPNPPDRVAAPNDQKPNESFQSQESNQEAVRRLMHWKPGIQHWASFANGPSIVFRPLIALVAVLWNTLPSQTLSMVKTISGSATGCTATLVAALNGVGRNRAGHGRSPACLQLTTAFIQTCC